ncbi:MAG: guanylate kinase [Paenibacillaceae bacterium]|nr:guanylate kinase [Paenibacillaceae bacterium]
MSHRLVVLQGPSAAGKSTLQAKLGLPRIVTWTSRTPREGELHGREYYFGSAGQLRDMYASGELLEITEYQGNMYGTSMASVSAAIQDVSPHSVVLDASGALKVKERFRDQVLLVGVYAEKEQCARRLAERGLPQEEQERRLAGYDEEVRLLFGCDLVIPNRDQQLKQAVYFIEAIGVSLTEPWD